MAAAEEDADRGSDEEEEQRENRERAEGGIAIEPAPAGAPTPPSLPAAVPDAPPTAGRKRTKKPTIDLDEHIHRAREAIK